ncbi:hypothetical protein AGABI2DRAFT_184273 [Agaricus bisporus var. bisporus H97]|uniref:hypothetical protein n=1 Tax=Agaricus bisporus var. bisporus (strain H97 / ATCC MYA-4626 / FGSC 10389) TaxID=936046 RepID=UPI00029F6C55|nr:hypothetical protein AGABI2DRAFT_184273 [Agaricus bisporus var. bisporus H97]EKV49608.1 hypothetical protein AGABI2DRAFT_184273 [Agaricus bisporus var. bisporus H97]
MPTSTQTLSEQTVQDAFHSYLRSSLTHAKMERLLDADVLSSAEGDLMITGPALSLYFAALRCTTNPPSVPLPRNPKSSAGDRPMELSYENCPPTFISFLRVWSMNVPAIQSLAPEHQHDLARLICGLPAIQNPVHRNISRIAAELRAVALEISQRRSFQDRFASALQTALDAGNSSHKRASFVPPPVYEPTSPSISYKPDRGSLSLQSHHLEPPSPSSTTPSPTILAPGLSPSIEFIRETLYAALGDVLEEHPSLRGLLSSDPCRAYFASVSLAILFVSTEAIDQTTKSIIGVLGTPLTLDECPRELQPLMAELMSIGEVAGNIVEEDNSSLMDALQRGEEVTGENETRLERVKKILIVGVGYESRNDVGNGTRTRKTSVQGRAVGFANRIGELALRMMSLPAFRQRQDSVFKVLAGIGG